MDNSPEKEKKDNADKLAFAISFYAFMDGLQKPEEGIRKDVQRAEWMTTNALVAVMCQKNYYLVEITTAEKQLTQIEIWRGSLAESVYKKYDPNIIRKSEQPEVEYRSMELDDWEWLYDLTSQYQPLFPIDHSSEV